MEDIERRKIYAELTESSRKWVSVMDAKAGFLSALNAATLAFIWTGAKLTEPNGCSRNLAITATVLVILSLFCALHVVLPKTRLDRVFSRRVQYGNAFEPISFFGFVAKQYPAGKIQDFIKKVESMDGRAFSLEAIEQHYTVSHIVQQKSESVARAGWLWFLASVIVVIALIVR